VGDGLLGGSKLELRVRTLETEVKVIQALRDSERAEYYRALAIYKEASDRHFEDLNHARARDGDLTATFLPKETYDKSEEQRRLWQKASDDNATRIEAKVDRLTTIGSVLLFIIPLAVVVVNHFFH
jgi:hypothetical protein